MPEGVVNSLILQVQLMISESYIINHVSAKAPTQDPMIYFETINQRAAVSTDC